MTTKLLTSRNVNAALEEALWWLKVAGTLQDSRNGPVLVAPGPVVTTYTQPTERVLFSELRDANPFFHLMESIWMLAGANDVAFPAQFAKQIAEYSDDGKTLYGAYGRRWRHRFGYDQLNAVIRTLIHDSSTRRAVLTMWDAELDPTMAENGGKDVPCNTHAYFSAQRGVLDMTVCCRSNDAVWGCYGANAVHFSMLQQFVAESIGLPVGEYTQFSNNLHVYTERKDVQRLYDGQVVHYHANDLYKCYWMKPSALLLPAEGETSKQFLADAEDTVLHGRHLATRTRFFQRTVSQMLLAHEAYKSGDVAQALRFAENIEAADWKYACVAWLGRRSS